MAKVEEITIMVGQTIQVKQFEPRVYQTTVKMKLDSSDKLDDVIKQAREIANNEVRSYFEGLSNPEQKPATATTYTGKLIPEVLTQPNVPKPLHGIAPRTIKGVTWWNKTRQEVYKTTDYHCAACGVSKADAKGHAWLEAHEYWDIDYVKGEAKIQSIIPLCHYCHNFIHSGRLSKIMGGEKSESEVKEILAHGFNILAKNKLKCFPDTLEFAENIGVDTQGVTAYDMPESDVAWSDWKLIFEGQEYKSQFANMDEWKAHYDELNKVEDK